MTAFSVAPNPSVLTSVYTRQKDTRTDPKHFLPLSVTLLIIVIATETTGFTWRKPKTATPRYTVKCYS